MQGHTYPINSAVCGATSAAIPESPAAGAFSRLRESVAHLEAIQNELIDRLGPILLPETPTPGNGGSPKDAKCSSSPLVEGLDRVDADVRGLLSRATYTIGRLSI